MSAGVCGKRVAFEEIFGYASPLSQPAPPSAKRSRCSHGPYESPQPDLTFGFQEKLALLLSMFSSVDREVVENVLNVHDHKVDDAIKSLRALCICDDSAGNDDASELPSPLLTVGEIDTVPSEHKCGNAFNINSNVEPAPLDESMVDTFIQETMTTSNWDDARARVTNFLDMFVKNTIANCKANKKQEFAVLKEQLQCFLRENQILKRAVVIQHERNLENDSKLQEMQQLKLMIHQYEEHMRNLELTNYTLRVHLQRAQHTNSVPNQFHPDIF